MEYILAKALEAYNQHSGWILWNLFLAFIPLVLSFWLFRWHPRSRSILWWVGLVVFVAFLPNAPYLLTDIIHLIRATRSGYSALVITLFFIPLHVVAIISGFEAYVISLINQGHYLCKHGAERFVNPAELLIHALCAIGVYMGRFQRFNSWDLVTQPNSVIVQTLDELTAKRPIAVIVITFIILTVAYWIMKQITLGLVLRYRQVRSGETSL